MLETIVIYRLLPTCESFFPNSTCNVSHSKVSCEGHMTSKPSKVFSRPDCMWTRPKSPPKQPPGLSENAVHSSRPLVEKMANSSFKTDHTVPLLEKAHALKAQQAARKAAEKG